ncbi:zyxin [Ictalurus punctatus]|uniref:Zyxin n=1 Tax=Ictalurus punctatus TaxID=7998 RepID=A0A2D0RFU8_ICTPU|nr:zyxin [Ictalurus punctatus]XP_017328770.1 zyxin [Ictalurus punctatus]
MEDSNGSKPLIVTSSLSFQVNAPSFYNQPKKFASVAPPRPKGLSNQSQPPTFSSSIASTATVGRVGEIPPPLSSISDDFPPPPPPVDAELPAPPPECHLTPTEVPLPAFPPPPPVAEDLPLPAPPEDVSFIPSDSSPAPPPPPPPPPPAPPLPESGTGVSFQKSLEKQTSFDRQLDSLTDMLSEMETRRPFNPKVSSQLSSVPTPKPFAPPPTAPKPSLSFLPPPELQDRPPPAPWAEELCARTTLRQGGTSAPSAPASGAPLGKGPAATLKTTFTPSQPASNLSPKPGNKTSSTAPQGVNLAPKVTSHISFPPPPLAPPGPPPPPASVPTPGPAVSNAKASLPVNQEKTSPRPVSPQPKPAPSPTSTALPYGKPMASPTPSKAAQPKGPGAGAPSGGVPLSMREVEELERMTKDFIKDMDNRAPVITSAPTEVCGKCGEALSRSQPAVRAMDKLFHSHCFCCVTCQRPLQGMQFYDRDGTPECEECYVNSLAVCSRCGERITDRVLKAVGQCFHAHCFRCTACSCTLEGSPFITDDNNNPYCVPDYHRRFSPLCVSCNEPIVPDPGSEETLRVVALEKNFHLKCYRCEDCSRPLSIEADADGCYPLDGRILCMTCHTKRAKQAMK